MNYILSNDDEISLIKFVANFQYLDTNNAKIFFKSKKYYKTRISELIKYQYLRRKDTNLVLGALGIEYCKLFNYKYTQLNRNQKYLPRLLYISNLATYYYNSPEIQFTPSFNMKDKQVFTTTSRKFIRSINYKWYRIFNISHIRRKR